MFGKKKDEPVDERVISVRLICGNCGTEGRFETWDEAFGRGWDTVERFGYNACSDCPGVSVYFPGYYAQLAREAPTPEARQALLEQAAAATMEFERSKVA